MSRYEEAYHEGAMLQRAEAPSGGVASIHDSKAPREKGLARLAVSDVLPRRGAVDRFLPRDATRQGLERGETEDLGDFAAARYEFEPSRREGGIGVVMDRSGEVAGVRTLVRKKVCVEPDESIGVEYEIRGEGPLPALFSSEWNLAFLTGDKEYARFEREGEEPAAASERRTLESVSELSVTDRLRGTTLILSFEPECTVWTYPLETASQSEGGLERVFQGTTLVALWDLEAGENEDGRFAIAVRAETAKE